MGYIGGLLPPDAEAWEKQESSAISYTLQALSKRHKLIIMLSVGLVTSIEISNRFSVNVILPDLQGNVAANADEISWVVILYNLGFLCSMALASWMTRVLGSRKHLLLSIGLYATGAFGSFLSAHNLHSLLTARLIMGFGGGAFLVRTVILIGLMFPGKERLPATLKFYGLLFFFLITYPTAIGWISDASHWNYSFLLDIPFLAIGALLISKYIPHGKLFPREEGRVDWRGAVLLIAALSFLQVALNRGERDEWLASWWITATLIGALLSTAFFVIWESRRGATVNPVFHFRAIRKQPAILSSLGVAAVVGSILGSGLIVWPLYLRNVQNYSTMQTGMFFSMFQVGLASGDVIGLKYLLPRLGARRLLGACLFVMVAAFSSIVYIWTPTTPTWLLMFTIFVQGFSLGPGLLSASNLTTSHSSPEDLNDVTTMFFFVRQLGNTFGVTAATVALDRRMNLHSARLLDVANRIDPTVTRTLAAYSGLLHRVGVAANPSLGALQLFQSNVIVQSSLLTFIDIYLWLAIVSALGLLFVILGRFEDKYLGQHIPHL
jgi:MFS transporter, DHA2 family, multidrug resistance protein